MSSHQALLRAARFEYALLRAPLQVVENLVVRRYLPEDSAARQNFERTLRFVDELADSWLFDRDTEPDASPFEAGAEDDRSDGVGDDAADADEDDGDVDEDSDKDEDAGEDDAEVTEERISDLADELSDQEPTGVLTGELAENDELRRVQAELKARSLIEEQQEHDG